MISFEFSAGRLKRITPAKKCIGQENIIIVPGWTAVQGEGNVADGEVEEERAGPHTVIVTAFEIALSQIDRVG